jgi:hypothetical protein
LGGRQTAPGEWRWVTGPDAAADNGKGVLFWTGYESGHAPEGRFSLWMFTPGKHGGKWDVGRVCCVTCSLIGGGCSARRSALVIPMKVSQGISWNLTRRGPFAS